MAIIPGTPGADFLVGTPNADLIVGDAGDDVLLGEGGNDEITGNPGNDRILGNAGADTLTGNEGNDVLYGEDDDDTLLGSDGNDQLNGDRGNDRLDGGSGNDVLNGGTGRDILIGGSGNDNFVLTLGMGGRRLNQADIIQDFGNGRDRLGLGNGLRFADLVISQGTGRFARDTVIRHRRTREFLAVLRGVNRRRITRRSFQVTSLPSRSSTVPLARNLEVSNLSGGGSTQTFTVEYADSVGINVLSLRDSNIRVTGPNSFNQLATFVRFVPSSNAGFTGIATYQITAPDGVWDGADNGTYQIELRRGELFNNDGNFATATTLGQFTVNSPPLNSTVTLAVAPTVVSENGGTAIAYTFTRNASVNAPLGNPLTVNFTVGGTAIATSDYTPTGANSFSTTAGSVTFAPNATTATVLINPIGDTAVEPDETVVLTLAPGAGYAIATPDAAIAFVTNDDTQVTVSASPAVAPEGSQTGLIYTFERTGVISNPLTVNFTISGSATLNTDYSQSGADTFTGAVGTVVFAVGQTSATVRLLPVHDTLTTEPNETVTITMGGSPDYTIGTPAAATGTIINGDATVALTLDSLSTEEDSGGALVYTFTRNAFLENPLTVNFSIGGTATFGTDYTQTGASSFSTNGNGTGTVTFAAGANTATVTIIPQSDSVIETDETVILSLTPGLAYLRGTPDPVSATIANEDGVVKNLNNDGAGSLRQAILAANNSLSPNNPTITFIDQAASGTITLTQALPAMTRNMTIAGTGAGLVISGSNTVNVFSVNMGATIIINSLTVENGKTVEGGQGGGLFNNGGTVQTTDVNWRSNSASQGGAIANIGGTVDITGGEIANNTATSGGGIYNNATLNLTNVNAFQNLASAGAGMYTTGGAVRVLESDFYGNGNSSTAVGGGIFNSGAVSTLSIGNSIFGVPISNTANNDPNLFGTYTNLNGNTGLP